MEEPAFCAIAVLIHNPRYLVDTADPLKSGYRLRQPSLAGQGAVGCTPYVIGDGALWFEASLEQVFAGHAELLLRWRGPHRGPEQDAQEYGSENRDRDFAEIHRSRPPAVIVPTVQEILKQAR